MPDLWSVFAFLIQFVASLAIVVVVVEAMTEILVTSALLDILGLRPLVAKMALPPDGNYSNVKWYHTAIHKLLSCGYCASVWVALIMAWSLPGEYFGLLPWDNIIVKAVLIHRLSNWLHVCYELMRRGRVHSFDVESKIQHQLTVQHRVEIDDAREVSGGDREAGATAGRGDLPAADGPLPG